MPKRTDLKKLMLLGSGPIVIGQACEFDYSGTQACKALREEGYEVILVNSNPATIMTDPESADRVYIEPLEIPWLEKIIEKEKPDALIPTLGGQTALNAALALHKAGILKKHGVKLLGASVEAIEKAEDREKFKELMLQIGASVPESRHVNDFAEGVVAAKEIGFPIILRPSFTLGGSGGGIAYYEEEFKAMLAQGLAESPTSQVLLEQSLLGWKEYELEVMRDEAGTFVVICSIENFDPMGVHTGDSITIAPAMTLSNREYQAMRDEARKIIDAVGVATGGANIQFAVDPKTGQRIVIEMNPRVSRSSALASKATGFPIAKIAAKLAVGMHLDEIINDITKTTPSCFEPAIDYVVTKIPRFNFEKFPGAADSLTTQMRSVGEVMALGRTFKESLQKALVSLERDLTGFNPVEFNLERLTTANSMRMLQVAQAFRQGMGVDEIYRLTSIDPWFLRQVEEIVEEEKNISGSSLTRLTHQRLKSWKAMGFTDARIAELMGCEESEILRFREEHEIFPQYWVVDTCAGEFESQTPYYYSTYGSERTNKFPLKNAVVVLGSGPNRIGQAIEFDYGCVQGVRALRTAGKNAVMINSNPETVSTDYDTSNALFFEPLSHEHVLEVLRFVNPESVSVQWGGQTPINLARFIQEAGYQILGSSSETIDLAENRELFSEICKKLGLRLPRHGNTYTADEARRMAQTDVGFPVLCRPSFVLGGRRMEVIETLAELDHYLHKYPDIMRPGSPLLIDEFLQNALEVDVDLVSDGKNVMIGGIVEHIEAAGVHSGDSMGVLPPQRISEKLIRNIEEASKQLALVLKIIGHLNLQLAVKDAEVYVLEANPRSSRSVPFVSKATGVPIVYEAVNAMLGKGVRVQRRWDDVDQVCVKGVVFPFKKFPGVDTILGPEMKSTGESMGRAASYPEALEKAFVSAGIKIPRSGTVFLSLKNADKESGLEIATQLRSLGYDLIATRGTAHFLQEEGVEIEEVKKVIEGRPHCVDRILSNEVQLVINTTQGSRSILDSFSIRRSCVDKNVPCITEISAAKALVVALATPSHEVSVSPLNSP